MSREEEIEMSNPLEDQRAEEIRKNRARMHSLGVPSLVGEANALCKKTPLQNTRKKRTHEDTIQLSTRVLRSHLLYLMVRIMKKCLMTKQQRMKSCICAITVSGDEEDGQKKKGGRKRTRMHSVYDRLNMPPETVHYNAKGQPDGENASELSNFISTLVKSHIPIAHADWRQVNITWKTEFMKTLRKFYVVDDELKDWVWGTAHKKWRDFKSYLKEKYFKEEKTDEDLHVCRDDRVTIDDWQWLITFWRSEEFQKRSEQGKQNRSKMKVLHTAGSKSYACVASEMYKENGYAPRRDELFLRTHTKRKMDLLFIAILPK